MPPRSSRVRWCRLRLALSLAVVPLLLLPLGVMKWRADHPPLSKMDSQFRADLSQYPVVYVSGSAPGWQQLTGMPDSKGIMVKDKAALRAIMETLRLSDRPQTVWHTPTLYIFLRVPAEVPGHISSQTYFTYARHDGGSYYFSQNKTRGWGQRVAVQPRFAPRFEALVARLAQRAQAPGNHPDITLGLPPEEASP